MQLHEKPYNTGVDLGEGAGGRHHPPPPAR